MAFNHVGFATIAPGGTFRWGVIRNGGEDFGGQIVMAHPETPGAVQSDAETIVHGDDGRWTYWATFTNLDGARAVSFSMCGGGLG